MLEHVGIVVVVVVVVSMPHWSALSMVPQHVSGAAALRKLMAVSSQGLAQHRLFANSHGML